MNLSAVSTSAAATLTPMPKVGTLDPNGFLRRNEDVFLGNPAGKEYSSLKDALGGAAGLAAHGRGGTFAVSRRGDAFVANELLQPVWTKKFAREDALGYDTAELVPLAAQSAPGEAKFGFYKYQQDKYGSRENHQRTGTFSMDSRSGVAAIVGADWALVDGVLQSVQPTRPEEPRPPVPPTPPVDPNPPVDPKPPVNPGSSVVQDVTEAARLASEALRIIGTVPVTDKGDESTKDVRIKAYNTNMAAQARIEQQFAANNPQDVLSTLRSADASLEDANWQLAKKPSPDGRFNGVDVPGAQRDTQKAVDLLNGLLDQLVAPKAA